MVTIQGLGANPQNIPENRSSSCKRTTWTVAKWTLMIPLGVIIGIMTMTASVDIIKAFPISNFTLNEGLKTSASIIGYIPYTLFDVFMGALNIPFETIFKFPLTDTLPSCSTDPVYGDMCRPHMFLAAAFIEEFIYRYLIQKKLLLKVASIVPEKYRYLVENKITRIMFSSLVFAVSHKNYYDHQGAMTQTFLCGISYGFLAETPGGIFLSTVVHLSQNQFANIVKFSVKLIERLAQEEKRRQFQAELPELINKINEAVLKRN